MLELIKQRLKSKTYRVALLGIVLTWVEAQSGVLLGWLDPAHRPFVALVWPVAMMTLREFTTAALGEKNA